MSGPFSRSALDLHRKLLMSVVMNPVRGLIPLGLQLSVCVWAASATTSLWGKKLVFDGRPCLWQLQPAFMVPALEELTACLSFRYNVATQWTGFVYKAPGAKEAELGLGGIGGQLRVWLFETEQMFETRLRENAWHSVCLTWSRPTQRMNVYVNGTLRHHFPASSTQRLAANGMLTLGVSHYVDGNGQVQAETGTDLLGEIGLFRMWGRERGAEELRGGDCVDGDVVSWDQRLWKNSCPPRTNTSLRCAWSHYRIKMWTFIVQSTESGHVSLSLEGLTRKWLESVFPHNMSVHDIYAPPPSRTGCEVINPAALAVHQLQGSGALSNTSRDKCFSSEVLLTVEPSARVEEVQANVSALLTLPFSDDVLSLAAEPRSLSVLPVECFPTAREPPTTGSTETGRTQSLPARPFNASTTGGPDDLNQTNVAPDVFFRVNLSLSMTGSHENPEDVVEKWAKEVLEVNKTMTVLNLSIKKILGRNDGNTEEQDEANTSLEPQTQFNCTFHVQERRRNSIEDTETFIKAALASKYENGSVVIQAATVSVQHIVPGNCLEESTASIYGSYSWAETFPQDISEMICLKPFSERASRLCKLDIETDTSSWAKPDMTRCQPLVSISDLNNITVTTGNTAEVVDMIQDLVDVQLGASAELSSSDLTSVVDKLGEVVDISVKPDTGANIVNIISNILLSETDVTPVANVVLNLTNKMGDTMDFQSESVSLTAPSMALSMVNVDPRGFEGLTFGVSSSSSHPNPSTFVNQSFVNEPLIETVATISLPTALNAFFPSEDTARVQFQFYGTHDLFQDPEASNSTQANWTLNSFIISASINNSNVNNLTDRVVVTLRHHSPTQPGDEVQCRFWDFQRNGGQGGWNGRGCETRSASPNETSCLCDHLTHFAVLLDVSRTPLGEADSQILTVISYVGCGASSIFLGITLLTYLAFEKLRRDYPSQILINLSVALLGLDMVFLLDSWLSSFSDRGLCVATAAALHYFLLASFAWMGLEAVHMYFALVRVFNTYVPSYILKFAAVGWGVPLVIVSLVLAIDKDAYGSSGMEKAADVLQPSDSFCWLQDDSVFYATVLAFILLILLLNACVFIVVLIQIRHMKSNKPPANGRSSLRDLRAVASLTVLLGLTWSVGFFSFGPGRVVLMYLFTIFNTLQGFFVFLFHCLMKENVRKQWRIHLCCGRFRLSEYSDWSRSVTVGKNFKKENLVNSDSLASGSSSTIRKESDSSRGSATP